MAELFTFAQKFNPASYEGIEFLVPEDTVERGKKIIVHEYPNSDYRYVEELGKLPPIIDIRGIIHGSDAFNQRNLLEQRLEAEGTGELVHPYYGSITVQPGPFKVSSSQKRIGEFIFAMKFYTSIYITPVSLPADENTVYATALNGSALILDNIDDFYEDPVDADSLENIVDTVNNGLDTIEASVKLVTDPVQKYAAQVSTEINKFRSNIYSILQTGSNLKESLLNVYNNFIQLSEDPQTLSEAWDNLITFTSDTEDEATTVSQTNTRNNQSVFVESINLLGIAGLLAANTYKTYDTTDELQEAADYMNTVYSDFFVSGDFGVLRNSLDVRNIFAELHVLANKALDEQLTTAWRITTVTPNISSMALIAYQNYKSLDYLDILIKLNPSINVGTIKEEIKIITE